MTEPEPFGFRVEHPVVIDWSSGQSVPTVSTDKWMVYLPHQCDVWSIADDGLGDGVMHAEAVEALERFVAEAEAALVRLRRGEADDAS